MAVAAWRAVQDVRSFWNSRAGFGQWAGTRDVIAKQLEIEAIRSYVRDGMRVLELGCGNGITALTLARRRRVAITALDFAEEMIQAARGFLADQAGALRGTVEFGVGDIRSCADPAGPFDVIYTERTIINLPDWAAQREAIARLTGWLSPGGRYVMCENSQDGLDRLNALRRRSGLPPVVPPWHNRYLRDAELRTADIPGVILERVHDYSSTYYFLSRVVNAWLAARSRAEPAYESRINRLALRLPAVGRVGQGRIWVWRKRR